MKIPGILLAGVIIIAGFGYSPTASAQTDWQCPADVAGGTLQILGWGQYVAETTIPDFEAACDVQVEYNEFGSGGEMLTTLRAQTASFDLVIAPGDVVQSLIDEELIQQLDASRIPNQANITVGPQVISVPLDYLVPYQWGTIGIAYDTTIVSEPITSWDGFLAYEGRVAWVDDGRLMLSIALSKLGYPLASIDEAQLQEAADYLLTVPNNDVFAVSANNQTNLLLQGEVDAIVDRSRNVLRLIQDCECEDFAYSLPEDGFLAYYDAMVVPANAQNATLAHAFMDYILVPQVNANLSNALGSATPVIEAYALVDEAILNNGVSYVTAEFLQAYLSGEAVVVEQYGQRLDLYLDEWTRVKGELVN